MLPIPLFTFEPETSIDNALYFHPHITGEYPIPYKNPKFFTFEAEKSEVL